MSVEQEKIEFQPSDLLDPNKLVDICRTFIDCYSLPLSVLDDKDRREATSIGREGDINLCNVFGLLSDRLGETFPELKMDFRKIEDRGGTKINRLHLVVRFLHNLDELKKFLSK